MAQAYYLSGNKAGCVKYVKGMGAEADETTLQLEMKCAFDATTTPTSAMRWSSWSPRPASRNTGPSCSSSPNQAKNLTDHQSLDIYRLKYLTGTMAGKDDYINMAQLDLQLGLPGEAAAVLDKGTAAGLLNDDRSKKLQALAKQQSASGLPPARLRRWPRPERP